MVRDDDGVLRVVGRAAERTVALSDVTTADAQAYITHRLERLGVPGAFPLVGFLVGLAVFTVIHAAGWNAAHVIGVVLPLGAILALLYLWRRQIWFVIIVHTVIDLPLVVMALAG